MLPNLHEEDQLAERLWFLRRPAQLALDLVVLCVAFLLAYLPADSRVAVRRGAS